ncbi:uncharacterized protein [Drosophila kikkawai]|uniref:MADF domain-containing protein n=1 Tax=Drosophila kikkawai TaxID=30033 RepID=A0A6P4JIR4_DROKI|nr:uncharacterized protein LOC108083275 [Drosophila kikkawai]
MVGKWKKRYSSRIEKFSARGEKMALINAVKAKPIMWDLNHKDHFNARHIKSAWEEVAAELQKDVSVCRNAWKSLRASMRYHQKMSITRKTSGSAAGSDVPDPKANDDYDWVFAPHMTFLPDLWEKRGPLQLPKPPEASTLCETSEESEDVFAEYLDESQPSSPFDQSMLEEQELQLQKEIEDMEKERADRCVLTQKFSEYVDLQKSILSQAPNVRSLVSYWGSILQDLPKELQDEAEERVTKLLWDLKKRAKNYR